MIVVTGATGKLGRLVVAELLKRVPAKDIVAAVRTPSKAADLAARGVQVRQADYTSPASLAAAFKGADKVLLISASEVGQRAAQHTNAINAAKTAGVKHLAYTSVLRAETSGLGLAEEHKATEQAIRASGLPFTFLRHGWYMENYSENLGPVLQHGAVLGSAKDGRVAAATRADFAAAAAVVMSCTGHEGKIYELAGDQRFTMADLAAEVARQTGKPIVYKDLPASDYAGILLGAGVPKAFAELLADSDVGIARGELDDTSGTLSALIGRPTARLAAAVTAALKQ